MVCPILVGVALGCGLSWMVELNNVYFLSWDLCGWLCHDILCGLNFAAGEAQ